MQQDAVFDLFEMNECCEWCEYARSFRDQMTFRHAQTTDQTTDCRSVEPAIRL